MHKNLSTIKEKKLLRDFWLIQFVLIWVVRWVCVQKFVIEFFLTSHFDFTHRR